MVFAREMLLAEDRVDLERAMLFFDEVRERLDTVLLPDGLLREVEERRLTAGLLFPERRFLTAVRASLLDEGTRRRSLVTALPLVFAVVRDPVYVFRVRRVGGFWTPSPAALPRFDTAVGVVLLVDAGIAADPLANRRPEPRRPNSRFFISTGFTTTG
jgi:hypothetical protein